MNLCWWSYTTVVIGPISFMIFTCNLNTVEVMFYCNSISGHQIIIYLQNVCTYYSSATHEIQPRAEFRFAPSQWETALLCNNISHWLGASLESALQPYWLPTCEIQNILAIDSLQSGCERSIISIEFELWWWYYDWNSPLYSVDVMR